MRQTAADPSLARTGELPLICLILHQCLLSRSGHFHADEALAVFLLRLLPSYQNSSLVRTRDPEVLDSCHTVVDVGGVYDAAKKRFDHHQRGFEETFPGHGTKLSSAGLVYLHFGKDIIHEKYNLDPSSQESTDLYNKLYSGLVEAFDANDNGISVYDTKAILAANITRRFEDRGFNLASVVNRFNYDDESKPAADESSEEKQRKEDERFLKASAFVGQQFLSELSDKARSWLPARAVVREAYQNRHKNHASGKIMVFPEGLPWADHLYDFERLEAETGSKAVEECQVLYVLFPESTEKDSKWRIRAVGVEGGGFINRKDLPDDWKGMRDQELSDISGIPGCVFVHAGGFIGGNHSFEGALEMAKKAVAIPAAGMEL